MKKILLLTIVFFGFQSISLCAETKVTIINANSFDLKIEVFLNTINIKNNYFKTAAFQMNKIDDKILYKIFIQNGLKIDNENIVKLALPKTIYPEFNGGLKSVFTIEENDYALISNKKKNCVFASIINLTKLVELFKSKCLPTDLINEKPDFNGIGGAVASIDDDIYLTIGAPESRSEKIRELAQSNESIFFSFCLNFIKIIYKFGSIADASFHNFFTASIDFINSFFSLSSKLISSIFSTPFLPIITGTPA